MIFRASVPDALCDFYGYNGYQTVYNGGWAKKKSEDYVSRAFYKSQRDLLRIAGDINGNIGGDWYWNAGLGLLWYKIAPVNIDMINKGKKPENMLPYVEGLYDKYVKWGIIPAAEANGGWHPYLRGGLSFDNRDRLQNTKKGMNADFFLDEDGLAVIIEHHFQVLFIIFGRVRLEQVRA